jgi:uncharacterized membrane protein YGL010W
MARLFRPAGDLLTQYAAYHRDRRNISTHLVGVPMIVFAICLLLARPVLGSAATASGVLLLTPAGVLFALASGWYLTRGHFGLGLATALAVGLLCLAAHQLAAHPGVHALAWGAGLFVLGWVLQFVGHYYEGRKPAFVDDVVGLLVAPMFVVLELGAALGTFKGLAQQVTQIAGPTHLRDLAHPATR